MKQWLCFGLFSAILSGCASAAPFGNGPDQGYFLGEANILSNVQNLCVASNNQYAFKAQQYWLAGGTGATSYGCSAQHIANLQPEYSVAYSIVRNNDNGNKVVSNCEPVYKGSSSGSMHFTQMNVLVQLGNSTPTCQMVLN